jgi:phage terminase small subunit
MPKLTHGLSQKMKNFCHAYMEHGNAVQAYLDSYNTTNYNTAAVESSRLLQRDDIREYMDKLNSPVSNKIINERQKKRSLIWRRIQICEQRDDDAALARYMDILNKMDAEYVNINRNVDDTAESLAKLDTEQLKQLLDDTAKSE